MSDTKIAVVGLGYVGLTLATVLADLGCLVEGVERRKEVVDLINAGQPHFIEVGLKESLSRVIQGKQLKAVSVFTPSDKFDVYIITVGTPLDDLGRVRLDMIERAAEEVGQHMRDGALVILRSTVKIGTTRNIVAPILRRTGKRFELAMCPERTLEGRALEELRKIPQIIGADSPSAVERASKLFGRLTNSLVKVSSWESAEIVKLVDNTYRDVSFAFSNEVARVCEVFGVNVMEVVESGKLGYHRTNLPIPGPVGGPCLEKDPHILIDSVKHHGVSLEITQASRLVNERQPQETVDFIVAEIQRRQLPLDGKIVILGMAFKGVPATDDLRGSMSLKILRALKERIPSISIALYDSLIASDTLRAEVKGDYLYPHTLNEALKNACVAIIANNHPSFAHIKPREMLISMTKDAFIYDYWNHFSSLSAQEKANAYFSVGNIGPVLS